MDFDLIFGFYNLINRIYSIDTFSDRELNALYSELFIENLIKICIKIFFFLIFWRVFDHADHEHELCFGQKSLGWAWQSIFVAKEVSKKVPLCLFRKQQRSLAI
ncbi:hypothetical protein BpHYR1_030375 [Brachionus plicatilis]|uniref:Uncharacterized protein n=1 Tax=Brachionus plicatilis TaxID=10195 RepID=A0A3M7SYQ0_BRAPC|nr:hypothetical protein BpHYR1_030375 [Brachionus plicatilis]